MKTKQQLISFTLICAFTAAMTFVQNPQVLPKLEEPFSDAKIGRTYKDSKPGTITLTSK